MSARCLNCQHWEAPNDPDIYPLGQCTHDKNCNEGWYPGFPNDGCVATDPFCGLETGQEFSCVSFAPRTTQEADKLILAEGPHEATAVTIPDTAKTRARHINHMVFKNPITVEAGEPLESALARRIHELESKHVCD